MASMTFWTRLESQTRQVEVDAGLQARLYDPLWLLARQWQLGEFAGEDAGSPVSIRVRADRMPLTHYHAGQLPENGQAVGLSYDPASLPLETLVEREPVNLPTGPGQDLRLSAEIGLHFFSLLEAAGVGTLRQDYLKAYPLHLPNDSGEPYVDPESRRFLVLMARRAPDGLRLYTDLKRTLQPQGGGLPGLPSQPLIKPGDRSEVILAGFAFLALYEAIYGDGLPQSGVVSAWNPQRMEYSLAVSAPAPEGELVLVAPEYPGGRLDWEDFNVAPGAALGSRQDGPRPEEFVRSVIPTRVRYRGMPANRWWEFEDAQVNLGRMQAAPDELMRLLLAEFALVYGNDWFVAPVEAQPGALYRVRSLVVTDAFGVRTLIPHYGNVDAPDSGWSMFALDSAANQPGPKDRNLLFLPPVLAASLHGPALEQVLLVRDEMANMAWAVERLVASAIGQPVDRVEAYHRLQSAREAEQLNETVGDLEAVYRLARPVPDHWLPLVPVREEPDSPEIHLRRGRVLLDHGDDPVLPAAHGRILEPGEPLILFEEEVPRTGVKISLSYQSARWIDGTTHLWLSRQKVSGRGEGSSGLRFDQIDQQSTADGMPTL